MNKLFTFTFSSIIIILLSIIIDGINAVTLVPSSKFELYLVHPDPMPYTQVPLSVLSREEGSTDETCAGNYGCCKGSGGELGIDPKGTPFVGRFSFEGYIKKSNSSDWISVCNEPGNENLMKVNQDSPSLFEVDNEDYLLYHNMSNFFGAPVGNGRIKLYAPDFSFPITFGYISFKIRVSWLDSSNHIYPQRLKVKNIKW